MRMIARAAYFHARPRGSGALTLGVRSTLNLSQTLPLLGSKAKNDREKCCRYFVHSQNFGFILQALRVPAAVFRGSARRVLWILPGSQYFGIRYRGEYSLYFEESSGGSVCTAGTAGTGSILSVGGVRTASARSTKAALNMPGILGV